MSPSGVKRVGTRVSGESEELSVPPSAPRELRATALGHLPARTPGRLAAPPRCALLAPERTETCQTRAERKGRPRRRKAVTLRCCAAASSAAKPTSASREAGAQGPVRGAAGVRSPPGSAQRACADAGARPRLAPRCARRSRCAPSPSALLGGRRDPAPAPGSPRPEREVRGLLCDPVRTEDASCDPGPGRPREAGSDPATRDRSAGAPRPPQQQRPRRRRLAVTFMTTQRQSDGETEAGRGSVTTEATSQGQKSSCCFSQLPPASPACQLSAPAPGGEGSVLTQRPGPLDTL